jgi:hypothetical protein
MRENSVRNQKLSFVLHSEGGSKGFHHRLDNLAYGIGIYDKGKQKLIIFNALLTAYKSIFILQFVYWLSPLEKFYE